MTRIIIIALAAFASLASAAQNMTTHIPATTSHNDSPDDVYGWSVRVIVDAGYDIATKDDDARIVVTAWERGRWDEVLRNRYRWRVAVDEATVSVRSQCQESEKGTFTGWSAWSDCEQQPEARSIQSEQLASDIANGPQ